MADHLTGVSVCVVCVCMCVCGGEGGGGQVVKQGVFRRI